MSGTITGAGLGLLAATGALTAIATSPPMRRIRLDDRLAPYLRDVQRPSRLLAEPPPVTPFPTLERLLGPVLRDLAHRIDDVVGGASSVRRRLDQAGRRMTLEEFRMEQVLWGAAGLAFGLLLAAITAMRGSSTSPIAFLILAFVLLIAGILLRDRVLTAEVVRRDARLAAEFPTIAELLALAIGAGEGPVGALERVVALSHGELARELGRALADARSGSSIVAALEQMAARTTVPALARFVDGMAIAVERGTPLAAVMRAQATDAREEGRRALMAAGGRKEIAMLVPVVFMVLPVTVVFALFPGFFSLRLAVP
ncbi:MAG: type II secretion system F family protein [Frankiaceae bacterium]|nr:type II secretion system F family protein [Frankiaceae bacterium]MBV9873019.1 type II secretion system F family protein [Frankiaceae bacterium]